MPTLRIFGTNYVLLVPYDTDGDRMTTASADGRKVGLMDSARVLELARFFAHLPNDVEVTA